VAHEVFVSVAQNIVAVGAVAAEVESRIVEDPQGLSTHSLRKSWLFMPRAG
jgi:hypothetical protein